MPAAQTFSCPCQARGDGAARAAQRLGRFVVRLAFQVAQDDRQPIARRQSTDLLVEDRTQFVLDRYLLVQRLPSVLRQLGTRLRPAAAVAACADGHTVSDAVLPAA